MITFFSLILLFSTPIHLTLAGEFAIQPASSFPDLAEREEAENKDLDLFLGRLAESRKIRKTSIWDSPELRRKSFAGCKDRTGLTNKILATSTMNSPELASKCEKTIEKQTELEDQITQNVAPNLSTLRKALRKITLWKEKSLPLPQKRPVENTKFSPTLCENLLEAPKLAPWFSGNYPEKWKHPVELIIKGAQNDPKVIENLREVIKRYPSDFNGFMDNLAQSHPEAQVRLLNKINTIPPGHLGPIYVGIARVNCPKGRSRQDCVSIGVSDTIDEGLTHIMKGLFSLTFRAIEKAHDLKIYNRLTNPKSFKYLATGYPSKPKTIKAKTAAEGLIAGLIPFDQNLSKASAEAAIHYNEELREQLKNGVITKTPMKRDGYYAILENGVQQWMRADEVTLPDGKIKKKYSGKTIDVVADPSSGLPIAGDTDTALIAYKPRSEINLFQLNKTPHIEPNNGIESKFEAKIRAEINAIYKDVERPGAITKDKTFKDIVHHGPDSRNPAQAPIDYPWVDSQNRAINGTGQLSKEMNDLINQGYEFYMPKHWRRELSLPNKGSTESL